MAEGQIQSHISSFDCVNKGTVQAYVAYTVTTEKPDGQLSVAVRRFSDFEWLHGALETEFKDVLIPPIPTKDALGRFTRGVVQYRKREFNRFLKRLCQHPRLNQSKNVDAFLTFSEEEFTKFISPEKTTAEKTSSFFSSVLTSVSTLATTLTIDVQEIEPWFSSQEQYLNNLEREFENLKHGTNSNTKIKSDLIDTTRQLSDGCCSIEKFEGLGNQSASSKYFGKLSEVYQSIAELDETVVKNETEMFEDAITDQQRLTSGAKRLLTNRSILLGQYQEAQKGTDLEARTREAEKKDELENFSSNTKTQIETFKANKSTEMRWALRELVRENIEYGEQMLAVWKDMERFLDSPEAH